MTLRLIGDLHGNWERYLELIQYCDMSIQIGDFGYDYKILDKIDPARHKVIRGNHERHDLIDKYPHFLDWYGLMEFESFNLFWVSGAWSIDKHARRVGVDWFESEEMNFKQMYQCYLYYQKVKPNILLAHELPTEAIQVLGLRGLRLEVDFSIQSATQQLLQKMIDYHRPERVIGGHWHLNGSKKKDGCKFTCIGECCHRDIEF